MSIDLLANGDRAWDTDFFVAIPPYLVSLFIDFPLSTQIPYRSLYTYTNTIKLTHIHTHRKATSDEEILLGYTYETNRKHGKLLQWSTTFSG